MGPAGDAAPLLSGCTATLLAHCTVGHHTAYVPFLGGHVPLGIANENVLLWGFAGPAPALGMSQVSLHRRRQDQVSGWSLWCVQSVHWPWEQVIPKYGPSSNYGKSQTESQCNPFERSADCL